MWIVANSIEIYPYRKVSEFVPNIGRNHLF